MQLLYAAALLSSIGLTNRGCAAFAQEQSIDLEGVCESSSFTAVKMPGSAIAEQKVRLSCNAVAITLPDGPEPYVKITFRQAEAKDLSIITFAGHIASKTSDEPPGATVDLDHLSLGTDDPLSANRGGWCTVFWQNHEISELFCKATSDGNQKRTTVVVTFTPISQNQPEGRPNSQNSVGKQSSSGPKMGIDNMTGGSPQDTWQQLQSNGQEIFVMTNGKFFDSYAPLSTAGHNSGRGFVTNFVENLPASDIVGAPQSVMRIVEGNCDLRHYSVLATLSFSGKNRSGLPTEDLSSENVERKLIPGSVFEKAFDLICTLSLQRK